MLPIAGGILLALVVAFGVWVRSVPPKETVTISADSNDMPQIIQGGDVPEFMNNVDSQPLVKQALDEASEALKEQREKDDSGSAGEDSAKENVEETIEL